MKIDLPTMIAIAGMAIVTYLTRISGLWLMTRLPPSPRLAALLRQMPGAILTAIIAPATVDGGLATMAAVAAAMALMAKIGNVLLAMAGGVGLVLLLRGLG